MTLSSHKGHKCSFVVNPKWPWLGASPDGIISIGEKLKTLEKKCPYSKKDLTIEEACQDKTFFMELITGRPCLKKKHKCFYQCQGEVSVTQTEVMDFIVYTNKETFIQNITFDNIC